MNADCMKCKARLRKGKSRCKEHREKKKRKGKK